MTECQSARMSEIKNGALDQHGTIPFEQQQFGTAGIEGVKTMQNPLNEGLTCPVPTCSMGIF